jgi:hypothetical protein
MCQSMKTNRRIGDEHGSYTERCLIRQQTRLPPSSSARTTENAPSQPASQSGLGFSQGAEMGQFNLGSTVVLVFEAPKNFRFDVEAGQKIKMGELLGSAATNEAPVQHDAK